MRFLCSLAYKKGEKIMLFIGIIAVILFVPLGVIFELAKKY
jgi:hypothetical protein